MTTAPGAAQEAADDTQAQADFDAGVAMETQRPQTADEPAPPPVVESPAPPTPEPTPEFVQLTKEQFERLETAAKRTDDYDKQMSKAFGTIGDVQKIVRSLQGQTPRGAAIKIPDDAFAPMERDFPEVAQHMRSILEATLKGMEGTGAPGAEINTAELDRRVAEKVRLMEVETLEDQYPDWLKIVGAVDTRKGEAPDPNNAFRKWLATKDQAYQAKVNGTDSAAIIGRAIRAFKTEGKSAQPQPDPRAQARASRIQEAVRPKGDGGPPPARGADDEFDAGFRTG